jgi:hypothetical protein
MRARPSRRLLIAFHLIALPAVAGAQLSAVSVPGSDVAFDIDSRTAKVGDHLGRKALFVRGQSPAALVSDVDFVDGTIEFDLSAMPGGNFFGLVFRYDDPFYHENVYFRLHRSGSFEAVQYAPRVNSSAGSWQLYPEFMARAILPVGSWVHVRAEIAGQGMTLFVGDSTRPLLIVSRLRGATPRGRVGFWGRVNDRPDAWTAAVSNVRVRPRPPSPSAQVDTTGLPEGTLTGWQIAGPYEAPDSTLVLAMPEPAAWSPIGLEEGGLLNITKRLRKPRGGRHVAFLRNTIRADRAEIAALEIGYSDDAMVWLNGSLVFRGWNAFNSRYPGFLGLVVPPVEELFLALRPGDNSLVIAVGERAFGWGLKTRLIAQPSPATRAPSLDQ